MGNCHFGGVQVELHTYILSKVLIHWQALLAFCFFFFLYFEIRDNWFLGLGIIFVIRSIG